MTADDSAAVPQGGLARLLARLERAGNKLPDPVLLFAMGIPIVWVCSMLFSQFTFTEIDPNTIKADNPTGSPLQVNNLLTGPAFAAFLAQMVATFTGFHPLGVVLVALLGVGVADRSGLINALIRSMLGITPKMLLTPMLTLVALISHTGADAGYVLVIPLGGIIFKAAGRHPIAGIAAAFAGVSGGFSANFLVSGLDPLLAGLTQSAANIVDKSYAVNPLCNLYFTMSSSLLIIFLVWLITDRFIEPYLWGATKIDGDGNVTVKGVAVEMKELSAGERRGMWIALGAMALGVALLVVWALPENSALRASNGSLTSVRPAAPLMGAIVPLIFVLFLVPGVIYGYIAGTFKEHRDVIGAMTQNMQVMGYYIVMAFFAALFINAFEKSNIGVLVALKGGGFLRDLGAPGPVTISGIILLTATVNLLIGSASTKWALLAPIFVPMLMTLGLSPELTQAAFRIGDSSTNIVTPMLPYFAMIVTFAQQYSKKAGLGTLVSLMLPYSVAFLIGWTLFLIAYWQLGFPLGVQAAYEYIAPK